MSSPASDERQTEARVVRLPNNITIVATQAGEVLVNSPPETLKFLIAYGRRPPALVLLPPDEPPGHSLGSSGFVRRGISYASVEFLLYSTFFGQGGRRLRLITVTEGQAARLRRILEETVSGPLDPAFYGELAWVQRECTAVGNFPPLGRAPRVDDMAEIVSLEAGGGDLGAATVALEGAEFVFREGGSEVARVSAVIDQVPVPLTLAPPRPLQRGDLTLQFIGGSDGFDPTGITTCFLAYLGTSVETQATLFDAAAYMTARLGNLAISASQIAEVVISHLHEDHFAGLPELILMGGYRVRVVTSELIYRSMLRLMGAMLGIPEGDVAALFDFSPVNPGQPLDLNGRHFEAIYAVHSVPTIAVRVNNLCYSGDMRYDEAWFSDLEARGVLSRERREELLHFAEGASVLVQDAGGGPIHSTITPELLHALTSKSQRLILAHTSKHMLPPGQDDMEGRVAFAGSGHVFALGDIQPSDDQVEIRETIAACPLFARLPVGGRVDLAGRVNVVEMPDGTGLIREGELSDGYTYIVHSGLVEIWLGDQQVRLLGRGSSIGERGALQGGLRTSSMRARGQVQLLRIPPDVFGPIAEELGLAAAFAKADWLWQLPVLRDLPWASLLDLALEFQPRELQPDEELFACGELGFEGFLLVRGAIQLFDEGGQLVNEVRSAGEIFGGRAALYGTLRSATARAAVASEVWSLPTPALQRLHLLYPNLLLHLRAIESERASRPALSQGG